LIFKNTAKKAKKWIKNVPTLLSEHYPAKNLSVGCILVLETAVMSGSERCFSTTPIPNPHKKIFLSSEVDTNFLP